MDAQDMLKKAVASMDAAGASLATDDFDAATDDLLAARLLITTLLLHTQRQVDRQLPALR